MTDDRVPGPEGAKIFVSRRRELAAARAERASRTNRTADVSSVIVGLLEQKGGRVPFDDLPAAVGLSAYDCAIAVYELERRGRVVTGTDNGERVVRLMHESETVSPVAMSVGA